MNLSLAGQERLGAASVDASSQPPSDLWQSIVTADRFERNLIESVRSLLADTRYYDWVATLRDAGVTAHEGRYAQVIAWLDRPPEHDYHQDALEYTAALGQGQAPTYSTLDALLNADLADGPLAVLDAADCTPTIAAHLDKTEFAEQPRQQRENTLRLLSVLDTQCDVYLICTGLTARWLADTHRSDLPLDFDDYLNTTHDSNHPTEKLVDDALRALDPEGGPVQLLRALSDEPTETVPQASLPEMLRRDSSTVSQYLSTLKELGLVDCYSVGAGNHISLRDSGSEVLDRLNAEIGRQSKLDSLFDRTGKSRKRPCNPAPEREGEGPPGQQPPAAAGTAAASADDSATAPYHTRFLDRTTHDATASLATSGAITVSRGDVADSRSTPTEDLHVRGVSHDADRDEVIVAVRGTTPLQYITSIALSLASPRLFDNALPLNRLDEIDLSPFILRSARCIGCLSSEAETDPQVLRDNFIEWGEELAEMTTDLRNDECDDRGQLRSEIMRSAHGLAGSLAHLLDVAGVDLIRELRIPSPVNDSDIDNIMETVSVAATIQSTYGHYATYRQLFEDRPAKLETALSPQVDAADPYGTYIGSLVVRSPSPDRVLEPLADHLADPLPVREDRPEIAVEVPLREADRSDYVGVLNRVGERKNLTATPEATALCQTLVSNPWALSTALNRLGEESQQRPIRLDEVRVALAHLDAEKLLPDATPTVSKTVAALLRSVHPLSKTELSEKAGVSPRSLRSDGNLDALVALDLVRETDDGNYRLTLPFATDDERGTQVCPDVVDDDHAVPRDVLYETVLSLVDDAGNRVADPDDPLGTLFFGPGIDTERLVAELPWIEPWVRVARLLSGSRHTELTRQTVRFGAEIEQQAVGLPA
jgi:DNA-binding transcriptional ArsR family regulator